MAEIGLSCALGLWIKKSVNETYFLLNLEQDLELWGMQTSTVQCT
jgi:hypothetical protein